MEYLHSVGDNNTIEFGWFVTLSAFLCVTPQQRFDWFTAACECDIFEFNFAHHQLRGKG